MLNRKNWFPRRRKHSECSSDDLSSRYYCHPSNVSSSKAIIQLQTFSKEALNLQIKKTNSYSQPEPIYVGNTSPFVYYEIGW